MGRCPLNVELVKIPLDAQFNMMLAIDKFMKKLMVFLIVMFSGCSSSPHKGEVDVNLTGKWAWSDDKSPCIDNWHKIYVDEVQRVIIFEDSRMFEQHTGEVTRFYKYSILKKTLNGYHLALESEKRVDETGRLVTWYLAMDDKDTYFWRQADWKESSGTKPIHRCKK